MPSYNGVNEYFRRRFGCKVYKLALNGGFTCPNRDGTKGERGCIFCLGGSGSFAECINDVENIHEQIEKAKSRVNSKIEGGKYIAYFQAYSNTYGDIEYMENLYNAVLDIEDIVALSIGTRPDCIDEAVLEMLCRLNIIKPVMIELGLQTIHQESIEYIRRKYPNSCYEDTAKRLNEKGIELITHIILGLPNETEEMILETVKYACRYSQGIKLQLLHVLKGTDLAVDYENGKFQTMTIEQYAALIKKCLKIIPENIVIHRITGDGDKKFLLAPMWSADKKRVLSILNNAIQQE